MIDNDGSSAATDGSNAMAADVMSCLVGLPSCSCNGETTAETCNAIGTCTWSGATCGVNPMTTDIAKIGVALANDALACPRQFTETACSAGPLCAWNAVESRCGLEAVCGAPGVAPDTCKKVTAFIPQIAAIPAVHTYLQDIQNACTACKTATCTAEEWAQKMGMPTSAFDATRIKGMAINCALLNDLLLVSAASQ